MSPDKKCRYCGAAMFTISLCSSPVCPGPDSDESEYDGPSRSEYEHDARKDER